MSARLRSVNVGRPIDAEWAPGGKPTAIVKHTVSGPVAVGALGLEGDQVADTKFHGGVHQAVYAFAREDLDLWAERIGAELADGMFGENLTTEGIDVNEALIGEQWRIGTAVLEVSDVRIPCSVFSSHLRHQGFDVEKWVKRFAAEGRPGPYLRVLEEGHVTAGDALDVVHRPDHGITVTTMFRALTTERTLLPRLLDVGERLVPAVRAKAEAFGQ